MEYLTERRRITGHSKCTSFEDRNEKMLGTGLRVDNWEDLGLIRVANGTHLNGVNTLNESGSEVTKL